MNVWTWVTQLEEDLRASGHDRVADLIDQISTETVENRPGRVAAIAPELLAAAKSLRNPWLEVFTRHWAMQSRMNNLGEGEVALAEATSMLEFAHREETRDCPQSVCVTQDIAKCYGNVDGPGWAEERLAVCAETLARITPEWNCYDCLSRETSRALMDAGRAQEAIAFLERQEQHLLDAGEEIGVRFRWEQAEAQWKAGHLEEALRRYEAIDQMEDAEVEQDRVRRSIDKAWLLSDLDRAPEAWEVLPEWEALRPGDYAFWTGAIHAICQRLPEHNTWQVGARFEEALAYLVKVGAHRQALDLAQRHAQLALERGAGETARRALAAAEGRLSHLRLPLGAPAQVAALAAQVLGAPPAEPLPVPALELLAHLRTLEDRNPERELAWLLAAHREYPGDLDLAMTVEGAYRASGLHAEALAHLWTLLEAQSACRPVAYRLLDALVAERDEEGFARLLFLVEPADPATASWARARWAFAGERWDEVADAAHQLLALEADPDAKDIWARAAFRAGDFATATRLRRELLDGAEPFHPGFAWDLMTAASAAQDWAQVRHGAKLLELELDTESGEIDEAWGGCLIQFVEDGEARVYFAQRTGPTTARILEPSHPRRPQHAMDVVVFDARPLEEAPEDEEARKHFHFTYQAVHTLHPAGYDRSWPLDGVDPKPEQYAALRDALRDKGWACWAVNGSSYTVTNPEAPEGEPLPGVYAFVALPRSVPPRELADLFKAHTRTWDHPMCWLDLARHLDQDVAHHEALVERYGL